MKNFLIALIFLPVLCRGQIYNVFQIKNQDTLQFKGNLLKLPPLNNVIHCDYLVELEGNWFLTSMTIDIATPGIELFGYAVETDGQFHLMATTNKTDQVYYLGDCVQYLLIRLGPGVWNTVNIDFTLD